MTGKERTIFSMNRDMSFTEVYSNRSKGQIAIVRYKERGHLFDDIEFEVDAHSSLADIPDSDEAAVELHNEYAKFARERILTMKDSGETEDEFQHRKWVEQFFIHYLPKGWTYDTLPTYEDCKRYEELELGACLPYVETDPLIRDVPKEKEEETLEKCGLIGVTIHGTYYRLRHDALAERYYLLREDFAVLCTRRKHDEIKGDVKNVERVEYIGEEAKEGAVFEKPEDRREQLELDFL